MKSIERSHSFKSHKHAQEFVPSGKASEFFFFNVRCRFKMFQKRKIKK